MEPPGHGGVLRRQPERVPAHGMEHVEAPHPLVPGHHVPDGVVAHVAHVDAPGRVREHLQHVVLGPGGVFGGVKQPPRLPDLLPLGFQGAGFVTRGHAMLLIAGSL